jgi:hypothetical protein
MNEETIMLIHRIILISMNYGERDIYIHYNNDLWINMNMYFAYHLQIVHRFYVLIYHLDMLCNHNTLW